MCCQYYIEKTEKLEDVVEEMNRSPLLPRFQRRRENSFGRIRPTDVAPALATSRGGKPAVFPMQWGFRGRTLLINARAESAASKPTFRESWLEHRCALPASFYVEWEHPAGSDGKPRNGDPFRLRPRGEKMLWLCGLYRIEEGLPRFVVLTREPGDEIRFLHDRMPLMLPENCLEDWIRPGTDPAPLLGFALTGMEFSRLDMP